MYKLCKTEQSAKRQRDIEEVFLRLMLDKHFDKITVSEICLAANIPRKSFYRYFDGKEGIIKSMMDHIMMDYHFINSSLNYTGRLTLRDEFEIFFSFWKERRELLTVLDKSGILGFLIESATNYAMSEYNEIRGYLSDSNDEQKLAAFRFMVSGLMTMMINWYRSGFASSVDNMSRATVQIITRPLFENLTRTE